MTAKPGDPLGGGRAGGRTLVCVESTSLQVRGLCLRCLHKLANLISFVVWQGIEPDNWQRLVDPEFIEADLSPMLNNIWSRGGTHLWWLVGQALLQIDLDELTPVDLRDIRNSDHRAFDFGFASTGTRWWGDICKSCGSS